jgi:DNA-binding transcriptional regulator YhcF (GntR family)
MIEFHLDSRSGVAYYVQIAQQVRHAIRAGLLRPGDQLPTVREVVASVAVNPNTVLRAYRDLDREGLLTMRSGSGTFVAAPAAAAEEGALYAQLAGELRRWIGTARRRGADERTLAALFDQLLHETTREVAT